jgi:putative intracellular protease/amidase
VIRFPYNDAEDEIIRRLWPCNHAADVAALIDRTVASIDNRAFKLGLRKTDAYTATVKSTFKPGHASWNKGRKGSTGTHANCRRTQFRPGRKPEQAHNYQPIGALRVVSGILQRKVTDDLTIKPALRWTPVTRLVWEAANGPIPKGYAVVFRPGRATTDADLITPDALEVVTRAELMRRNSYHNRYPKEVAQLIQLRGALNRKIRNRSQAA